MRAKFDWIAAAVMALGIAAPAAGQGAAAGTGPVPDAGMNAVTVSIGAAVPAEDFFGTGLNLGVAGEHYVTPRVSLRAQVNGAFWKFTDFDEDTARPVAITGNVVYNIERVSWHPYVTGGVGFYRYRLDEEGIETSVNKFGVNVGAGVEYFLTGDSTVLGEWQAHIVSGDARGFFGDYATSYWTLSGGYKKYF